MWEWVEKKKVKSIHDVGQSFSSLVYSSYGPSVWKTILVSGVHVTRRVMLLEPGVIAHPLLICQCPVLFPFSFVLYFLF